MGFSTKGVSATNEKAQLVAGEKVVAIFESAKVDEKGHLVLQIRNASGGMKVTEFNIDPAHPKYQEKYADYQMSRIKHVACGFVSAETVDAVVGADYAGWAKQLVEVLRPHFGKSATWKITLNNKNFPGFPMFPNFISTEFALLTISPIKLDKFIL